jgi:glycine/D-amino acid oxidase-like deaminating enzyme
VPPGSRSADFIVIGAGVVGASVAFHLARRGAGRVLVLERQLAAQGGSSRSSALVRMHYTLPQEVQLALESLAIFTHWEDYVGRPGSFRKLGFVRLVPPHEIPKLEANVEMQRALGVNTRLISARELQEIEPDWAVDDVAAAAYEPDSGCGDGAVTANDLLQRAREMGAEFRPRTPVHSFVVEGDRIRGVRTAAGGFEAPVVVCAAGPWCLPLFRDLDFQLPIEPEYHRVAILGNPSGMRGGGSALIDSITSMYLRSEGSSMTLVGEFVGRRGVDPDHFPQSISDDEMAEIALLGARRIGALRDCALVRSVTGVYDMTPDQRPLLGPAAGVEGLYLAAGFSGMGFKIAPAVGLTLAEWIVDGRATTVDLSIFDPGRFAAGRPIRAPHEYADE